MNYCWGGVTGPTPAAAITPCESTTVDMTATDGTQNSFFGSFLAGFYRFYGTSAAAPHAAAVAALMLQKAPCLTPAQVIAAMKTTAVTMPGYGVDDVGAGRVKADSAVASVQCPTDLTISKSHTGNFVAGSTGNTYTVLVTNTSAVTKDAGQSVSVTDTPPTGLTITAMSGTGWTCTTLPTCTRTDQLAPATAYPGITVTVTVAANAAASVTNSATVTTAQTESNTGNNTATDPTTITPAPLIDLTISKFHTGDFVAGSTGNTYNLLVTNTSATTKDVGQTVTVTDTPPTGLTITAMSGTGWTCTTLPTCTRTDALAPSSFYPGIIVTVTVASNAAASVTNSATVTTTQTESNTGNNTATDPTTITPEPLIDLTISKFHTGDFVAGSTGNTYNLLVTNTSATIKDAGQTVSVTDTPPTGLTITAMSGTGWTCTTLPTCTRTDALAPSSFYPGIVVTVTVAANAAASVTNSATVTTTQTESNTGNNTATDPTTITPAPLTDLTISKFHTGNFVAGSAGNTYNVLVFNTSATTKDAGQTVTVTDAPPTGLTITAMSGTGWTCTTLPTCTRTDALVPSSFYPGIVVTVTVAANAAASITNSATVTTTQTESNTGNNTATDPTTITGAPTGTIIVRKVTVPAGGTGFGFTSDVPGAATFTLDDGQNRTMNSVSPGTYSVTESSPVGSTLTNLVCTDPTSNTTVNVSLRKATIAVSAGETVDCTFTNTRHLRASAELLYALSVVPPCHWRLVLSMRLRRRSG